MLPGTCGLELFSPTVIKLHIETLTSPGNNLPVSGWKAIMWEEKALAWCWA